MEIAIAKSGQQLFIGRQGENKARGILFHLARWKELYGDGSAQLIAKRNGDEHPYPVALDLIDGDAIWIVSNADTDSVGYGNAELQYYVGDVLAKSEVWTTYVSDALGTPTEEPPEPQQGWVDRVVAAGAEAKESARKAEESAADAEQSANLSAESAQYAAQARMDANAAAQVAQSAKIAAQTYKQDAEKSAEAALESEENIKSLHAEAVTLPAGADATAEYDHETNTLKFGIPVRGGEGGAASWDDLRDKPFETIDKNLLSVDGGALTINTTDNAEKDNTRPITSSGVHVLVGNIDTLLSKI